MNRTGNSTTSSDADGTQRKDPVLRVPEIGVWPEPLEELPAGHNYVGWHNWMWIRDPGPATWGPITRTVTEAGYAITATAAVTKVTWEMGNGDTKVCDKGMEHLTW